MIRDFALRDQEPFRALVLAGMEERWGDAYDPGFNTDLDDVSVSYLAGGADVVVAEVDRQVLATGILRPEEGCRGRIVRMSVDRVHRRQGLARQVVEELLARARRRGFRQVVVMTDTPWESAASLYRSCGFIEVGRDDTDTHFALEL